MATKKDVDELARWMRETYRSLADPDETPLPPWAKADRKAKDRYRKVAAVLLDSPPAVLIAACSRVVP